MRIETDFQHLSHLPLGWTNFLSLNWTKPACGYCAYRGRGDREALNIFKATQVSILEETDRSTGKGKTIGTLDRCGTAMFRWIIQPSGKHKISARSSWSQDDTAASLCYDL